MPFKQGIDVSRPHTLLTKDPIFAGYLEYRYDDTSEQVSVPNVWYNLPFELRVHSVRCDAQRQVEFADQLRNSPPYNMTPERAAAKGQQHMERAKRILAEAARMEAAGDPAYPVAASLLPLDYGDNVL